MTYTNIINIKNLYLIKAFPISDYTGCRFTRAKKNFLTKTNDYPKSFEERIKLTMINLVNGGSQTLVQKKNKCAFDMK